MAMEKLNGTWLIGVSTGPDSMALLDMALKSGNSIAVAFVNYHKRKEADEEEAYIKEYCHSKNIKCHILNDAFAYKGNFEASARKWRYDFFVQTIKDNNYAGLLLGHQQDDVIETYLMQEEKGLTPSYYGIKEEIIYEGIRVKRPLINHTKQELIDYCETNNIKYYIDSTNNEDIYTRNKIRHEVVEKLSHNERMIILKEIEKKNAIISERSCRLNAYIKEDKISLKIYKQLEKIDRLYALRILLKKIKNYSDEHLEEVDKIIINNNDFMIKVDSDNYITQDKENLFLYKKRDKYIDVYDSLDELKKAKSNNYLIKDGELGVNALTLSESDFPITIRNYEEGDRIDLRFGTKKINRFFIDRKIPKYLRGNWPVVLDKNGKVIMVPGLGSDINHYSIKPSISVIQYY